MATMKMEPHMKMEPQSPLSAKKPKSPPSALKRPQSAYFLFAADVKHDVIARMKRYSFGETKIDLREVGKEVSALWAAADCETKAKYETQSAEARAAYQASIAASKAALDPVSALKAKYAALIPKRPPNAWVLFTQDAGNRSCAEETLKKEGELVSVKTLAAKLSEMWKALSPDEKLIYEDSQKKAFAKFEEQQKSWEQTPEFKELMEAIAAQRGDATKKMKSPKRKKLDWELAKESLEHPEKKRRANHSFQAHVKKEEAQIDEQVLDEARSHGYELEFRNLHRRPEMQGMTGVSQRDMLQALRRSNGLVHKAKAMLLALSAE